MSPTITARTVLAFDFGLTQIGVAVGNTETGTSQALATLKAKEGSPDWSQLQAIFEEWQPYLVVVGLPLNMDDSESSMSARARKFAARIHGRYGLPAELVDERLSSFEAKQQMREQGLSGDYKETPADSLAAAAILRTWLSAQ